MTLAPEREAPAATPTTPTAPAVGRPVDRIDGPEKTTGTAHYSADQSLPDLTHAAIVHASIAKGQIAGIVTAAAEAAPDVVAVITHLNAPRQHRPDPSRLALFSGGSIPYLATDEIFCDGQPVAVVVAETIEAAQHAASLVEVTYVSEQPVTDFEANLDRAKRVRSLPLGPPTGGKRGDARTAYEASEVTVDLTFTTPQHNHNAIEPHATTAVWNGDHLTVWDGSQGIAMARRTIARRFEVPVGNVHLISTYVGGGFGGKGGVWGGTYAAVLAARAVGRPVRLALTRAGVYRLVGGRTPTHQRVAFGATRDGRMTALIHEATTRTGHVGGYVDQVTACSHDLYDTGTMLAEQRSVALDLMVNSFMRAPGEAQGVFAVESAVDELAQTLGVDPVELRLRNQPGDRSPVSGVRYSHRRMAENLTLGRDLFGWADRPPPGSRDGNHWVGWGVACAIHPAMEMPASVTVELESSGTVTVRCGAHEIGVGVGTVMAQLAADEVGVPVEQVRVEWGDSELPRGPIAGGSVQSASIAGGVQAACSRLRSRLDTLRDEAGASPSTPPVEVLRLAGQTSVRAGEGHDRGVRDVLDLARFGARFVRDERRWMRAATGAHFCEVRIDADTGELRVSRWLGVFDIGRVLNPKTAQSQLRGGIVMGLGMATAEETLIDHRSGRIVNPSLSEYHVPVQADVPQIDVVTLDDPDPSMPMGVVGAGEVAIAGVAAAVANAVRHATGRRVTDLPITLDKVVGP